MAAAKVAMSRRMREATEESRDARRIAFIGPRPEAMHLLGNKIEARRVMAEAGVPVVAGTGRIDDPDAAIVDYSF